jgi:hypothetical protein
MGLDDHNYNRVNLTATGLTRGVTAGRIPPEGYLDASQVVDAVIMSLMGSRRGTPAS